MFGIKPGLIDWMLTGSLIPSVKEISVYRAFKKFPKHGRDSGTEREHTSLASSSPTAVVVVVQSSQFQGLPASWPWESGNSRLPGQERKHSPTVKYLQSISLGLLQWQRPAHNVEKFCTAAQDDTSGAGQKNTSSYCTISLCAWGGREAMCPPLSLSVTV